MALTCVRAIFNKPHMGSPALFYNTAIRHFFYLYPFKDLSLSEAII